MLCPAVGSHALDMLHSGLPCDPILSRPRCFTPAVACLLIPTVASLSTSLWRANSNYMAALVLGCSLRSDTALIIDHRQLLVIVTSHSHDRSAITDTCIWGLQN